MRNTILNKKHFVFITIFQLLIFSFLLSPSYAQTPDQAELSGSIENEIKAEISANTNAASIYQEATGQQPQQQETSNTTDVTNTGDNVGVSSNTDNTNNTTVNNNNDATVNQNVDATANTGNNTASRNISFGGDAGMIYTGDADINVSEAAYVNNNNTGISGGGTGASGSTSVNNTGDNVTTATSASGATTTIVGNNNTAIINQGANLNANTGNNHADRNIVFGGGDAGKIISGDASINASYMVVANGSAVLIGGDNDGNGPGSGASIYILNTGGMFSSFGKMYNRLNTVVNNTNNAFISQSCGSPAIQKLGLNGLGGACSAITGGNTSNGNIAFGGDAGVIRTGDAEVNVTMYASANSNTTDIENGGVGAGNNTYVDNTGNNVKIGSASESDVNTTVNNDNTGRVDQYVHAVADTGNNEASRNIAIGGSAGIIYTGDARVNVSLTAELNNNDTHVKSGSASLSGDPGMTMYVYNTGDNVDISATADNNTSIRVNNNNYLALKQTIISETNTGNNTADKNIATSYFCPPDEEPEPTDAPQPTSTPEENGGPSSEEGMAEVASAQAEKDDDGDDSTGGSVLGASTLPFTGSQDIFILLIAGLLAFAGYKLRNINFSTYLD